MCCMLSLLPQCYSQFHMLTNLIRSSTSIEHSLQELGLGSHTYPVAALKNMCHNIKSLSLQPYQLCTIVYTAFSLLKRHITYATFSVRIELIFISELATAQTLLVIYCKSPLESADLWFNQDTAQKNALFDWYGTASLIRLVTSVQWETAHWIWPSTSNISNWSSSFGPPGGPDAINTQLGWSCQGPSKHLKHSFTSHQCLLTSGIPPPLSDSVRNRNFGS